jgi:lipoprotein-anchoring transpeptidase ErfK/SrfK
MSRFVNFLITVFAPLVFAISTGAASETTLVISVPDQKMGVIRDGKTVVTYRVSTSKFGVGDRFGSYRTPVGEMEIASKIGSGLQSGAVLKGRVPTGEVLKPNAPGRDPIVTRIMVLRGTEEQNRNASSRGIYIHGTTEEKRVGKPVSFGCIRMRSQDVISVFGMVHVGSRVLISEEKFKTACRTVVSTGAGEIAESDKQKPGAPYARSSGSI